MKNLKDLCLEVIEIARAAGAFQRNECRQMDKSKIEKKGLNDLVSYVDKETEKMLVSKLSQLFPEAGFITEEGTTAQGQAEYTWVIDPLDGTTNFLHQLPLYSVSIGLLHEGKPVLGVIYAPETEEMFSAVKGEGAYLNGKQIEVSQADQFSDSLIATGFPYQRFEEMDAYLRILDKLMHCTHGLRRLGSAAIDLAYVACGRFEAFYEYNLKPWDIAAGIIIVEEAGGKVTDFKGGPDFLFGKQLIAGGPIHQDLQKMIHQHWCQ
ncbi:inositol monophosphatase family protein [Persicobacter sp. CCB-QB2]|uniref:inositol monophosphatase family protein n=1 Tax=Persicobacter sp. CCB-QB2 TaxID=1561025 RepID=UPI0006A95950|nr:inositol monophosphatase family protein [Persicobacter sp. CCB-QB2]